MTPIEFYGYCCGKSGIEDMFRAYRRVMADLGQSESDAALIEWTQGFVQGHAAYAEEQAEIERGLANEAADWDAFERAHSVEVLG